MCVAISGQVAEGWTHPTLAFFGVSAEITCFFFKLLPVSKECKKTYLDFFFPLKPKAVHGVQTDLLSWFQSLLSALFLPKNSEGLREE